MIQGRLYLVKWLKKQQWPNIISRVVIENKLCQLESIQVLSKTRNHERITHIKETIWLKSHKVKNVILI